MKLNRITTLLMLSTLPLLANAESFTVEELPTAEVSLNQFGSSIDNTGLMLVTATQPTNLPIDVSLLDFSRFSLDDPTGAAAGDFTDDDYTRIVLDILDQTSAGSLVGQKLSVQLGYETDGTDVDYINGLDRVTEGTDGFTFSQLTTLADSINGTHIIGTMVGPFGELPFTSSDGTDVLLTINDFNNRGFVQVGDNVTELVPEDTSGGGLSFARAINSNLQIAGTMSTDASEVLNNALDNCALDDVQLETPTDACIFLIRNSSDFLSSFQRRAVIWQTDSTGAVLSSTTFGLPFEITSDTDDVTALILSSEATDINDDGVAVGFSNVPVESTFTNAAVAYENGETIRLIEDDDMLPNVATGINNNNIVVGFQSVVTDSNTLISQLFYLNRNTNELVVTDGLFRGSSTTPRAINNNNQIVGDAVVDLTVGFTRRSGFLFDLEIDSFIDLNTVIPCDSEYTIVAANDINDNGEIIADALVRRPARGLLGQVLLDSNGEEVLTDTVIAVKLSPTGQEPVTCEATEEEIALGERQGAGVGFLTIVGLMMISIFRRKLKAA